jgi:hypothetical protein
LLSELLLNPGSRKLAKKDIFLGKVGKVKNNWILGDIRNIIFLEG